jgi:hypothetical protein
LCSRKTVTPRSFACCAAWPTPSTNLAHVYW